MRLRLPEDYAFRRFLVVAFCVVSFVILGTVLFTPSQEDMSRTLEGLGYERVQVGEVRLGGCSQGDLGRDFTGVQNGKKVTGVVCCNYATCNVRIELRR